MKKEDTIKNKTNALRILDSKNVSYEVLTYDTITSGIEVAKALNINPDFVYKTLVTVNDKKEHFVFMIPDALSLDLKKEFMEFLKNI